jgi:hypothetical protein
MSERAAARRRGHGEDSIYLDVARGRYVGAVSLGYGPNGRRIRRKVTGKTKQEVRDKLKVLHAEVDSGLRRLLVTRCCRPSMTGCATG